MKKLILFILLYSINSFSLDIILRNGPLNSGQIYIPCSIDSMEFECFYDSGAETSHVPLEGFEHYKKIGEYQSGGAAGVEKKYDEIIIKNMRLGEFSESNYKIGRSHGNSTENFMIGSSFFRDTGLFFDFKQNEITSYSLLGSNISSRHLKTFGGRPLIDINIQNSKIVGIWDTGAGLTTVDQDYINKNPSSFSFIQNVNGGVDSTGNQVYLKLYSLSSFSILDSSFENLYILGMDFAPMRKLGVPQEIKFIIGYNSIIAKNWYFDFAGQLWSIED